MNYPRLFRRIGELLGLLQSSLKEGETLSVSYDEERKFAVYTKSSDRLHYYGVPSNEVAEVVNLRILANEIIQQWNKM